MASIEITVYVGQADINTIEVNSNGEPLNFDSAGITKVACVIPGLLVANSDTDAVTIETGKVNLKLGLLVTQAQSKFVHAGRLVEYQGENDNGRTLVDDLVFLIKN